MKNISKKVTAILLSLMMAVVFMPVTGFAEAGITWGEAPEGVDVDEIDVGEFEVTIYDQEFKTYSFTPALDGNYSFTAESIFESEDEEEEEGDCVAIAFIDSKIGYDEDLDEDDEDDYAEAATEENYLEAGHLYYYQVKAFCKENPQATYQISLTRPAFGNIPEDESQITVLGEIGDQWSEDAYFENSDTIKTYRFKATRDMLYHFWGEGDPENDAEFTAFDEDGVIATEDFSEEYVEESLNLFDIKVRVEAGKVYYLQVQTFEDEPASHTLHLDKEIDWGSPDFDNANNLELGKSVSCTLQDNIKTYKFTAPEDLAYTISAKGAEFFEAAIYTPDGKFTVLGIDEDDDENSVLNETFQATAGQAYYFQFSGEYTDDAINLTIKIDKSNIQDAKYEPVDGSLVVYENTYGEVEEDEDGNEYFYYRLPDPKNGDKLIIKDINGETKTYVYDDESYTYRLLIGENELSEDEYIDESDLDWDSEGQEEKHWTLGSDNSVTVTYNGFSMTVPVSVVENPVESIEYTPAEGVEYAFAEKASNAGDWEWDEDDNKYFLYELFEEEMFNKGDILTVSYKDGRETVQYKFVPSKKMDEVGYFVNTADENDTLSLMQVQFDSDQYTKHWSRNGANNYVYVTYMGVQSNHLPIVIKDNIGKAKVTCTDPTYNGKVRTPAPIVKIGTKTLKKGTDYKLVTYRSTYNNYKNVGWYYYDIEGIGKYAGNISREFKILPKGTKVKKLVKAKKAITVKWYKQSAKMSKTRITGYQIQIATNSKFTKGKKLVTVKGYSTLSKKVTKLKAKKKYYVRVRTYKSVNGGKIYSKWSAYKTITTK